MPFRRCQPMLETKRLQSLARDSYRLERLQGMARASYKFAKHCATRAIGNTRGHKVVFVAGVQRSGTNMVMDVLERSPDTRVFHENDPAAFEKFQLRDDRVLQRLANSVAPCVVFKALCDSHRVLRLVDGFRGSSAIWVYRNYDDVVASHRVSWPKGRNNIDLLVRDRAAAGWRGHGMTNETWELVKAHYHPELSIASANALFWYYRNQLFFDQRLEQEPRVCVVKYEEFATNPQIEVGRMAQFLGIAATRAMSDHIRGSSVKRRPVAEIEPPVRRLCDEMLQRLEAVSAFPVGSHDAPAQRSRYSQAAGISLRLG